MAHSSMDSTHELYANRGVHVSRNGFLEAGVPERGLWTRELSRVNNSDRVHVSKVLYLALVAAEKKDIQQVLWNALAR